MPIYAYRCEACGFAKDVLQKISDPQLTVCLSCGKPTFKKQVTAAGFQLKGTGWYVTDFRGGSAPAGSAASPASASSDSASSSEAASNTTSNSTSNEGKSGGENAAGSNPAPASTSSSSGSGNS